MYWLLNYLPRKRRGASCFGTDNIEKDRVAEDTIWSDHALLLQDTEDLLTSSVHFFAPLITAMNKLLLQCSRHFHRGQEVTSFAQHLSPVAIYRRITVINSVIFKTENRMEHRRIFFPQF